MLAALAVVAFVLPSGANLGYPNKIQDCSRCHGPSAGTYFENIMSITVSKSVLAPGEQYTVGIDIVIQTSLSKKDTGYAIEDLTTSAWPAYVGPALQSHYDQLMTAPTSAGTYSYRVWGESGPATSDGKADFDDYMITVQQATNSPPEVTPLANKKMWAGNSTSFSVTATDPDSDSLRYTWSFGDATALQIGQTTTHIYAKAGTYTFTVYVDDLMGHNASSSATASIAFDLPLAVGWNFVAVPVVGFGYKASTIGLATGDMVVGWNTATQSYNQSYIVGISPIVANFAISESTGYWVWAAVAKTLHLYGSVPTTLQIKVFTVPSNGGWVALGYESLITTWHASDIPAMYSGTGEITLVASYNAVTGTYVVFIVGTPLNNFLLVPGQGCWVWATASGTLTYSP
jgi:hypothetical protein